MYNIFIVLAVCTGIAIAEKPRDSEFDDVAADDHSNEESIGKPDGGVTKDLRLLRRSPTLRPFTRGLFLRNFRDIPVDNYSPTGYTMKIGDDDVNLLSPLRHAFSRFYLKDNKHRNHQPHKCIRQCGHSAMNSRNFNEQEKFGGVRGSDLYRTHRNNMRDALYIDIPYDDPDFDDEGKRSAVQGVGGRVLPGLFRSPSEERYIITPVPPTTTFRALGDISGSIWPAIWPRKG